MPTGSRLMARQFPHKNLINAAGLYFFYYIALGAFLPYIYLYYERGGLSGIQIGLLAGVPILFGSGSTLILGGLTDKFHWHRSALRLALILCPLAIFLLSQAKTFSALIPIIIAYAIFNGPIIPLLDSSAIEIASEQSKSYGWLRQWGSIGWAFSTVIVGWLIQKFSFSWLFTAYIVFMCFAFFLSFSQPPRNVDVQFSYFEGLRELLKQSTFLLFLASIFLVTLASGGVIAFFSIYMDSIGAEESLIGWAWAISALSEMPLMAISGTINRHIGSKGLLTISFIVYAVRWLLLSFIHRPDLVLLVQLLNGPSFALLLVGSVIFVNEHTPPGLNTTALAIFNTIAYGFGSMSGSLLGGYIFDQFGLIALFQIFSMITLAGLAVFVIGQRATTTRSLGVSCVL